MALIGPAPEFGSDGAPPPLETAPILQGEEFYVTETAQRQDETSPREALKEVLSRKWDESEHRDLFALKEWFRLNYNFYPDLKITDARAIAIIGKREARRFRLFEFWRRDDPVVQLPPGVTAKITKTLSVGLTETRARELSSSIGLSGANPWNRRTHRSSVWNFVRFTSIDSTTRVIE